MKVDLEIYIDIYLLLQGDYVFGWCITRVVQDFVSQRKHDRGWEILSLES